MYRLTYFSNPKANGWLVAFAVIAAFALGGCAQEKEADEWLSGNEGIIAFDAYVSGSTQTRASEADIYWLRDHSFGVFAFNTGGANYNPEAGGQTPNLMYNQQVKWTGAKWAYGQEVDWPGGPISFFAYAPYVSDPSSRRYGITSLSGEKEAGDPKLTFEVAEKVVNQTDLLYASKVDLGTNRVKLDFKHALSLIRFKQPTHSADPNTTLRINKLTFQSDNFYSSGELNLRTGDWKLAESAPGAAYVLTANDFSDSSSAAGRYLMIIPPGEEAAIHVTLSYDVTTTDKNLPDGYVKFANTAKASLNITFQAGKAYDIGFKVTPTAVTLDATISDWEETTSGDWNSDGTIDYPKESE